MEGSKEQPEILIYRSVCGLVCVSHFIIVLYMFTYRTVCGCLAAEKENNKLNSCLIFASQDSDGDKSEDNLVVDVSNEVSGLSVITHGSHDFLHVKLVTFTYLILLCSSCQLYRLFALCFLKSVT